VTSTVSSLPKAVDARIRAAQWPRTARNECRDEKKRADDT
jgi:hypothetical protein